MQEVPVRLFRAGDRSGRLKGRPVDEASLQEVRLLIGPPPAEGHPRDLLIEHLHRINDHWRGLHERHLAALSREMNIPMAEVFEVASFYHHFEILRGGETGAALTVRVCDGLPCAMAGAGALLERLPALLGEGVRLVAAPCIGRCEEAPAALVGQVAVGQATLEAVARVCRSTDAAGGSPLAQGPGARGPAWFPLAGDGSGERSAASGAHDASPGAPPRAIGYDAYRQSGGYALATAVAQGHYTAQSLIATLEHAGLRGLGGAGFPAGRKWRIVREQPAPRLMAVNIDEGEPGTFKDRHYLERDPHRFVEGMLIAAHVVGVTAIYIYLRDEYHDARRLLAAELANLQADPPFDLPAIHLRRGAGAYICGEESAMIESIEGRRGEPRLRPPYIAQVGLFGRPTLEQNFETLFWVREIIEKGAAWFAGHGRHGRQGLRSFSVSGRVRQPGVKLAPAGITLRELLDEYCGGMAEGHTLYGYLPGGASGGILPASLADLPLDFDTLQPHGCFIGSAAVIVLGQHDLARDAALNMMRFFEHESCGQCTPCRVGTAKAARLMASAQWDQVTLGDLADVMADASICGLGHAAPNPIRCVQKYFPHEIV